MKEEIADVFSGMMSWAFAFKIYAFLKLEDDIVRGYVSVSPRADC